MRNDLKSARETKGLTQNQVAYMAEVSLSIVSRLESGRITKVSHRIARKLAPIYAVTVETILGQQATAATG